MKNFKRIFSMAVALIMIVATMSAMFVTASAEEVAAGTIWSPKNIDKGALVDGPFEALALLLTDNSKLVPEAQSVVEYGTWRHKVTRPDGSKAIGVMQPEKQSYTPDFTFGYNPTADIGGLLVFTAPADGTYSLAGTYYKLYGLKNGSPTKITVEVYKNGTGEALASVTNSKADAEWVGENVNFGVESVDLVKGDELWIVVKRSEETKDIAGNNVQIKACEITYVAAPQTTPSNPSTPSAPETADGVMLSVMVAVAVAGAAVVASKKRH